VHPLAGLGPVGVGVIIIIIIFFFFFFSFSFSFPPSHSNWAAFCFFSAMRELRRGVTDPDRVLGAGLGRDVDRDLDRDADRDLSPPLFRSSAIQLIFLKIFFFLSMDF
jgi:hypothetical protein